MSRHYRTIAGNLEFFLGAYLIDFGILGLVFFSRFANRNARYACAAAIVIGFIVLVRAQRMLGYHRAIFWMITLAAIVVPVGLLLPALLKWWR